MQTAAQEKERHVPRVADALFADAPTRRERRKRKPPTPDQLRIARSYSAALGIIGAPTVYVDGRYGWYKGDYRLGDGTVARALAGRYAGLSVAGLDRVGFVILDIDLGHATHAQGAAMSIVDFLDTPAGVRKRRRTSRAERKLLRRIRGEFPLVCWLPFASPRGLHAVAILAAPIPAAQAAVLADHVLERIGRPEQVEAFPKLEGGKGRSCRLPGTGGRLLDAKLEQRRHRLRVDDVRDLLDAPRAGLSDFGFSADFSTEPPAPSTSDGTPGFHRARPTARKDRANAQLFGDDFAGVVLGYLRDGIPDDHARDAVGKLSFTFRIGLGLKPERCASAFVALLDRGGHGSTQAQTRAGRAQLLRAFRSTLKHHEHGIAAGRLEPGKLASAEISAAVAALLNAPIAVRKRAVSEEPFDLAAALARKQRLTEIRRAAAAVSWARRRASAASASEQESSPCHPSPEKPVAAPNANKPAASAVTSPSPTSTTSTPSSPNCSSSSPRRRLCLLPPLGPTATPPANAPSPPALEASL